MPGVYMIRCVPTGEYYVGGTRSRLFCVRFCNHRISLRKGSGPPLLQAAWDRHGEAAFEFVPLKEMRAELVHGREQEAIWRLRPALNLLPGLAGECRRRGIPYRTVQQRLAKRQQLFERQFGAGAPRKVYEIAGEMLTCNEIAERFGLPLTTVRARASNGERGAKLTRPKGVHS